MNIEELAIKIAKANNGGEWATHYNEDQKNLWRSFAKEIFNSIYEVGYREGGNSTNVDWIMVLGERFELEDIKGPKDFLNRIEHRIGNM